MRSINTTLSLLLLSTITAAGCAADMVGSDIGDDDAGEGSGSGSDTQPVPLTPEGRFSVHSDFDVATNVPGTAGTVVNYFISATDDPDDPTKFIVEQVLNALPAGSIKNNLQSAVPFVAGYLNDRLLTVAPNFVSKIVDLGNNFGQVAHHFGTIETLEIAANGATVKTVTGLHFNVDNVDMDFAFVDEGMANIEVGGVQVTLDQAGKLTIGQHVVPLKYGAAMKLAMNKVILPMIDPSVSDLEGLLKKMINCQAVGAYIYDAIGVGSASTFHSACNAGLVAGGAQFYRLLDNIDTSALAFDLTGTARGVDKNRDGKMDDIQTGTWAGNLSYAGSPTQLAAAKFFGSKM